MRDFGPLSGTALSDANYELLSYNASVPPDAPVTKRQLAWLCLGAGIALALATLAADLAGAGRFAGLGPVQQQALAAATLLALFGLSLWPAGHRPA